MRISDWSSDVCSSDLALELNPDGISDEAFSFAHEVGVSPTKDARVVDVFRHLNVIHPSLTCAVDGDAAGNDYIATCCGLQAPPAAIVRSHYGWAIENVIGWNVGADVASQPTGSLWAT